MKAHTKFQNFKRNINTDNTIWAKCLVLCRISMNLRVSDFTKAENSITLAHYKEVARS